MREQLAKVLRGRPLTEGGAAAAMVEQVKHWRAKGRRVKIFTARVAPKSEHKNHRDEADAAHQAIQAWCTEHIGEALEVTNIKDHGMIALYDDRAYRVEKNTGRIIDEHPPAT